jgi:polyhydroxyalkanoate synthesis regulator phasin
LKRLEAKVDGIIARELDELKERVAGLEQRLAALETRASGGTRV